MRILVLGGGGREHAIVAKLAGSSLEPEIFVAPGNGGTAGIATNISLPAEDGAAVAAYVREHGIDLLVIGPEAPLVAGVADVVREAGTPVFGPGASGARLEGSKAFAKEFMARHALPTGWSESFDDRVAAIEYLEDVGAPIVIKADGLAAGKGVTVAMDVHTAKEAIEECFAGRFGGAGSTVVIEEYLTGPECSLLVFTDGTTVAPMAPAQDHKRAYDGDEGPNTGGMGVYSPVPIVTEAEHAQMLSIMERAVAGMRSEGTEYKGVLYGGFMLTDEGPKLLEFNARFGDPETQVILPRLDGDLGEIMYACAQGRLGEVSLSWRPEWAVSVVLASEGYPGEYATGLPIAGIQDAESMSGVTVYHAGTRLAEDGTVLTAGGRVLNVTALGLTFDDARDRAYEAVARISWDGMFYRTDIGARAARGRDAWKA